MILVTVYVVFVFVISTTIPVKLILLALCHLIIFPVWPDKVNVVELVPIQTNASDETEPPTEFALTVTATDVLAELSQLFTIWAAW